MKLSSKIVAIFCLVLMATVVVMSFTFYVQAKNFYKDQLTKQLEHRLATHAESIASHFQMETILHVLNMEREDTANFLLFDENITPLAVASPVKEEYIAVYQNWIYEKVKKGLKQYTFPVTEIQPTEEQPFPHIWSMQPIYVNDRLKGYLFIDQSTRDFVTTIQGILKLVIVMSIIIYVIALIFALYLTKVLTRPLEEMGKVANEIAKGNFQAKLTSKNDDEVGKLAKDILEMASQLKRYHDTRKQFLSHISHDLRTPLTYVKGYASIMKDAEAVNAEEWKNYASVIHKQATRMELLVQDLFQLARLEEGSIRLNYDKIDVYSWLEDFKESYMYKLKEEQIVLNIECPDKNLTALFDKERMEQVFVNLLENSIRYIEQEGTITITVTEEKEYLRFDFSDTGKGIPEEDLPYLFERFYRVDKSRSSNGGGSGLGLAIVKQIIQLHKGKITVASKLGEGTSFTIFLPKEGS